MTVLQKIDLKFTAGLLVGAVVTALIVVALMSGGGTPEPAGDGGAPAGTQQRTWDEDDRADDDDRDGEPLAREAQPPPDIEVPDGPGRIECPRPTKTVSDARELTGALRDARPGDVIELANGTYVGKFVATTAGEAGKPIFLCGGTGAILDGGGVRKGYGLHLDKADHWRLIGFTVRNSQKGVMADTVKGVIIQGLTVHDIGDEAVHLRNFSSDNVVQFCMIYNTGLRREKFGEGVYLGTAESNWKTTTGGKMDRSDNNIVRYNVIRATAEAIDVKEGTTGGKIIGNVFDGSLLGGSKHNDSWVDVKGNGYLIEGNRGSRTLADGFQTHGIVDGWGVGNTFRGNIIDLGDSGGVGINDTVGGNRIDCDNKVTGGPVARRGCT